MQMRHFLSPFTCAVALGAVVASMAAAAPAARALPGSEPGDTAPASTTTAPNDVNATASRFLKLWSPAWMGGATTYTEQQAVDLARRSSVIAAMPHMFKPYVGLMKAANPSLQILVYKNATFGKDGLPTDLYARDSQGLRIAAREWPDTYLMKLGDARWRTEVAQGCDRLKRASGYDGCFLDVLGSGPLTAPSYMTALPVNNGQTWTPNQWISWTTDIIRTVRATYPTMPVSGNGLGDGSRYFDPTQDPRPMVPVLDAAMPELFLRVPLAGVQSYRAEAAWRKDIEMVLDVQRQGRAALTVTKVWVSATDAQKRSWHAYSLASFMLATNGTSKFLFLPDRTPSAPLLLNSYNMVDIGTPLTAYAKTAGVYQRPFTSGLALVNPTTSTVTVPLTRAYVRLDGTSVSGSLTLPPNTGEVLRHA